VPSFRCPKCSATIDAVPDAQGVVACPQCGVKLRSKASPAPSVAVPSPPPSPAPAPAPAPIPAAAPPRAPAAPGVSMELLLAEIRAVRDLQEQILERLSTGGTSPAPAPDGFGFGMAIGMDEDDVPGGGAPKPKAPPMRKGRRKTVLLIDDDADTRQLAAAALAAAEVPVRTVGEGHAALAAIAEEKPDVIAIELDMGGSMGGKDVINMIKATMEWVDIPLVLYTRAPVASQKDARVIHGADEYVSKGPEGPALLVTRIISLFRRA